MMTRSLMVMRGWLVEHRGRITAIESTSTYWKARTYCPEEVLEAWLLAAVTHARRREYSNIAVNLVLAALAVFIAVGRFGPHAF